ncbi:STIP1-like proteiny and U box-containing protein 1 [Colletotrichum orbiculare MAFF 240422]|uniref:STIP1-like proteiny and U box-containing protein 1 n=3 Tax=Colletotrichum orbiculare species complex TaxID=2707354 RepID=N4W293_COLOR|nr:STIP1-like proteiny and U box-containing protein 1 [Colletotrichum orbiculare MAFF 240422]TDZ34084.1 STIP1-like proteiny and U box-containing protein 1 [Colletotrichum trifolii]
MSSKAMEYKEDGNRCFKQSDYAGAEALYTKAIINSPKSPALYTNRAMARLKLELWESVIADCESCIGLDPNNFKAYYYLSQAQLALEDYEAAVTSAVVAHEHCFKAGDKSLAAVTIQVRRAKKERWDWREARRVRQSHDLEKHVVSQMEKERDQALQDVTDDSERGDIEKEFDDRIQAITEVFEKSRPTAEKLRPVPNWAICDISLEFFVDPVITRSGKSYERSCIMDYLRKKPEDPITREPMLPSELRPNLDLKNACEEFLQENGWAVDY